MHGLKWERKSLKEANSYKRIRHEAHDPQQRTTFVLLFSIKSGGAWWFYTLPLVSWPLIFPAEPHRTSCNSWFNSYLSWRHGKSLTCSLCDSSCSTCDYIPSLIQPVSQTGRWYIFPFKAKEDVSRNASFQLNSAKIQNQISHTYWKNLQMAKSLKDTTHC